MMAGSLLKIAIILMKIVRTLRCHRIMTYSRNLNPLMFYFLGENFMYVHMWSAFLLFQEYLYASDQNNVHRTHRADALIARSLIKILRLSKHLIIFCETT